MVGFRIKSLIKNAITVLPDAILPAWGRLTVFRNLDERSLADLRKMESLDMIKVTRFEIDEATLYRVIGPPDPADCPKAAWVVEGF